MKKVLIFALLIATLLVVFVSCNRSIIDTTYSFERAVISLPNGEIVSGPVDSWADYENSDMIQVEIYGKTYLTHISNVVLISE